MHEIELNGCGGSSGPNLPQIRNAFGAVLALTLVGLAVLASSKSLAQEVERDRCECKLAHRGAVSTLAGGTCVRTESATCLMEWGGGSSGPVGQGNGLSQREASVRALQELTRGNDIRIQIPRMTPAPDNADPLQLATANLSQVPPSDYEKFGMAESFVLAAGTALIRNAKGPLNLLAASLLRSQRREFINILQKEGQLKVESFLVAGSTGCLHIEDMTQSLHIFVKTPFANSARC